MTSASPIRTKNLPLLPITEVIGHDAQGNNGRWPFNPSGGGQLLGYPSYAALAADLSHPARTLAEIIGDLGTHIDPVSSLSVPNSGIYSYLGTGTGSVWQRLGEGETGRDRRLDADEAHLTLIDNRLDTLDGEMSTLGTSSVDLATKLRSAIAFRPADNPSLFTPDIASLPSAAANLDPSRVASAAEGKVHRVTGASIVSLRYPWWLEPSRVYRFRALFRRHSNVTDPAGGTVRVAIQWLGSDYDVISQTTVKDTNATVIMGLQTVTARVPSQSGDPVTIAPPSNAAYWRVLIQTFDVDGVTDIEAISADDITDAGTYSPDLTATNARVTALESEVAALNPLAAGVAHGTATLDGHGNLVEVPATIINARSDIPSAYFNVNSFVDKTGARWIRGTSTGPYAVQDAAGTWWELFLANEKLNLCHWGAKGDNTTADTPALDRVLAWFAANGGGDLRIPKGLYRIDADRTIPNGIRLYFEPGAKFVIDASKTFTIKGIVDASPNQQIFAGAGTVVGIKDVYPDWFGAGGDEARFVRAALNCNANAFGSDGSMYVLRGWRPYSCDTPVDFSPTLNYPLRLIGTGTGGNDSRLVSSGSFVGTYLARIRGQVGLAAIMDLRWQDFAFANGTPGSGPNTGLQIGESSKQISGQQLNSMVNIAVFDFHNGIVVEETRLIKFDRCSVWQPTGVADARGIIIQVTAGTVASFTGDLDFEGCQIIARPTTGNNQVCVSIFATTSSTDGIAGIRFHKCIFYHWDLHAVELISNNGCNLADVWIIQCAADGLATGTVILIQQNGTDPTTPGTISNIQIYFLYVQGITGNIVSAQSNGQPFRITSIDIAHIWANGVIGRALDAFKVDGLSFNFNELNNFKKPTDPAIEFSGCLNFKCLGNTLRADFDPTQQVSHMVQTDGACDYYIIRDNTSAGCCTGSVIQDNGTGTRKTIDGNWN